jgi:hypothetical protein
LGNSLDFTIAAPAAVRRGDSVSITLRLANQSGEPTEVYLLGRTPAFDIVVQDKRGQEVWRRLAGETVPSILQVQTLGPGAALEWRDRWLPAAAGRYRMQGVLPSDDRKSLRTPWVELEVR